MRKVFAVYSDGSKKEITDPFNQTYAEFKQVRLSFFDYCNTFKSALDADILILD